MVKASLLGTSQIANITNCDVTQEKLENLVDEVAAILAENADEVFAVPDDGVFLELAMKYKQKGGKMFTGVVPSGDEKYGTEHIEHNLDLPDRSIEVKDWYNLNGEIAAKGDIAIVIGYSAGVFADLSFLKYNRKYFDDETVVVIFENTVSQKLPEELEKDIGEVKYITEPEELREILGNIK